MEGFTGLYREKACGSGWKRAACKHVSFSGWSGEIGIGSSMGIRRELGLVNFVRIPLWNPRSSYVDNTPPLKKEFVNMYGF